MLESTPQNFEAPITELTPTLLADLLSRLGLLEQALRDERERHLSTSQQPVVVLPTHEPAYPTVASSALIIPEVMDPNPNSSNSFADSSEVSLLRVQVQEWQYRYEVLWQEHQQARRAILELQQKIMSIPL